jgi:putative oxidoreductase
MDLGLLLIRIVAGGLLAGHGIQKLFGRLGGGGLIGTAGYLEAYGLRPGRVFAALAGTAELAGGVLLVAGLVTPVAAGLIGSTMLVAARTDHAGKGLWIFNGGAEYAVLVAAVALAVAVVGPGSLALDQVVGLRFDGPAAGAFAVVVALVGASGVLLLRDRRQSATGPADASGSAHMTDGAAM